MEFTTPPRVLEGYNDQIGSHEINATSGYVFTLGGGVVSWKSCKQTIIMSSTKEVELTTVDTTIAEASGFVSS